MIKNLTVKDLREYITEKYSWNESIIVYAKNPEGKEFLRGKMVVCSEILKDLEDYESRENDLNTKDKIHLIVDNLEKIIKTL